MRAVSWTCCLFFLTTIAHAQSPSTQPTTQATSQPTISPEASALLDRIKSAYAAPKSFEFTGHVTFDADAAGRQENHSADFTSSFESPAMFRHEMKDDLLLVCANDKLFAHLLEHNRYMVFDPPKSRDVAQVAAPVREMLQEQDPSLLLAISSDAGRDLTSGAISIEKLADVELDHTNYNALSLRFDNRDERVLIDPSTGFMRQMQIDLRRTLEQAGVPSINKAMTTIDYSVTHADAPIDADKVFAWSPPSGATLIKPGADGMTDDEASQKLVGHAAPAFSLASPDGRMVALPELKGRVVVLDFWASWCPPCRESLPHLSELAKNHADRAVSVFAVNVHETKERVTGFLNDNKFDFNVLLDLDGAVSDKYFVTGIPQTVVIGKDGTVTQVFIGFGEASELKIADAVDQVLAK